MNRSQEKVFTTDFILLCAVNFLFFIAFYMLIPVLPLYLLDDLKAGKSVAGILLSVYVLAALFIRPFSGHVVDSFPRKPVFLGCAFLYAAVFAGYLWITPFILFGILRAVHGMTFGMVNTSTVTLVVDIIPPARMGSGMGFFGITTAVPMAMGPMLGLLLYDYFSPDAVFYVALGAASAGTLLGLAAPSTARPPRKGDATQEKKSFWNRIFLPGAGVMAISLTCAAFAYGLVLNYISVYARERGITLNVGYYFCILAVGMIISRLFAGRLIDAGKTSVVIMGGKLSFLVSTLVLVLPPWEITFFASAFLFGIATGVVMPAYQTLFITVASPDQRGLANSSFFIAWDGGIGLALFVGGFIADYSSYAVVYLLGCALLVLGLVVFQLLVAGRKRKLHAKAKG